MKVNRIGIFFLNVTNEVLLTTDNSMDLFG